MRSASDAALPLILLGAGAFIGAGAVVIQSLTVGANAVVGAGMTLTRCLAAGNTQIGAPSRLKTT